MEYEKIKQIMDEMSKSQLTSMEIEFKDGTKISMQKEPTPIERTTEIIVPKTVNNIEESVKEEVSTGNIITSPMVGTFYSKPSPTDEPYVSLNKSINKGDTVCIIEAMKLMNEIESEYKGKIVEIYVSDGDVVEYGTKLFRIE